MSEYQRFLQDKGELKRYDYDLNSDSLVWDVGGYKGEFAENIYKKFQCWISIYEPVFYEQIATKFMNNNRIHKQRYGLSNEDKDANIAVLADATSLYKVGEMQEVKLNDIHSELSLFSWGDVDLIKINVEGEEYNILERMIETGIVSNFRNIQVQFHKFISHAEIRRDKIRQELAKTHVCEWCYEFIWESWRLK